MRFAPAIIVPKCMPLARIPGASDVVAFPKGLSPMGVWLRWKEMIAHPPRLTRSRLLPAPGLTAQLAV